MIVGTREGLVIVWNVEWASDASLILETTLRPGDHAQQAETAVRLPRLILPGLPAKGGV